MNRNLLFRKYFAIGIIISFLGISVLPSMARPEVIPPNFLPPQNIFFGIQSNINISWDENLTKDPIDLLHSPPKIPLNVTFWITWGLFGRLLNFFFLYKKLNVDFVIDTSPWTGYSSLAFDQLPLYVPPKENIQQITMNQLTIQLEYDTPAYVPIPVTVRASIDLVLGPAGSLGTSTGHDV